MLFNGEKVGDGTGPQCDVAVDPIDGTTLTAKGMSNAVSVLAVSPRGSMYDPSAVFYMEKLATGPEAADVVDIRLLIVAASSLLFVSAGFTLVAPGLAVSTWGAASARLRGATAAPALAAATARAATPADFDRLAGRLGVFTRLSPDQRSAFVRAATVLDIAEGTRIIEHGDAATSAYFILDGSTTAGIPVEDGYSGLSTMTAGDFFGEIGALTGSRRTADVVADVDSTLLEVPADAQLEVGAKTGFARLRL
jgi:hypothetical protein